MARRSQIIVDFNRIPAYERGLERATGRALERAASAGVSAARAAETRRRTGALQGSIVSSPVEPYRKGRAGGLLIAIVARDWKAIFHDLGTRGRRRRKLSPRTQRKRPAPPGSGIRPLYFLNKGLRAARGRLLDDLKSELSRVR